MFSSLKMTKMRSAIKPDLERRNPRSGQTQKSNATSGFRRLELCKSFKAFVGKCYKSTGTGTSWESLRMFISKSPWSYAKYKA